ncbi:MAG: retroviral-like aspartic protease family protein [Anaerolineales bacterium]|nr:retroviral-like aspartic protease family protein [Anaerolineales bacterium]
MEVIYSDHSNIVPIPDCSFANVFFIEPDINGKPIMMLFDTGAGKTVLTESDTVSVGARILEAGVRAGNNTGQIMDFGTAEIQNFKIGSVVIRNIQVIVVPDNFFEFGQDDTGKSFPAKGCLGWDIISRFCWEIDPANRSYGMKCEGSQKSLNNLTWDSFPIVSAKWEDEEIFLGFDSGLTETMLDNSWQKRLQNLRNTKDIIVGIGGSAEEDVAVADSFDLQIGNQTISLSSIPVMQHAIVGADSIKMSGLLGADVVQGRKWVIDFPNNTFMIW